MRLPTSLPPGTAATLPLPRVQEDGVDQAHYIRVLATFAQTLITDYGIAEVLHDLADDMAEVLGADGVGLLVCDDRDVLGMVAASDERSAGLDELQVKLGQGPAVRAFTERVPIEVPDLAATPLGEFGALATDAGLRSAAAWPMIVQGRCIGALGCYRKDGGLLTGEHAAAGATLAASACAFVLNARALDSALTLAEQLRQALDSRVIIEQAKGKLSAQLGLDVRAAFELMRHYSRNNRIKLHEVASQVVTDQLVLKLGPPD